MRRMIFSTGAVADLDELHLFYETQQVGLGSTVISAVLDETDALLDHPFLGRLIGNDLRRLTVRKHHVGVYYRVVSGSIVIKMVEDLRRDPKTIREKLERRG